MAQLRVTVIEGKNLTKKDLFSESDSYVQIYLNDQKPGYKTKVKRNSRDPQWNQRFIFNHLETQNFLYIDVYDKDFFFDDKIGSLIIDLRDLYKEGHIDGWYNLPSKHGLVASHGQIHLILDYQLDKD